MQTTLTSPEHKSIEQFNIEQYTTVGIVGQKGCGKTRLALALFEMQQQPAGVFLDFAGIAKSYGIVEGYYISIDNSVGFAALERQLSKRAKYIIDVSNLRRYEFVAFANALSEVLLRLGNYSLYIDEAGEYLPQGGGKMYSYELERLIRVGRNVGIRPQVLITQRPQKVDKNAFALCDCYIFFRLVHNLERDKIRQLLDMSERDFSYLGNVLMTLPNGQALLFEPQKYTGKNINEAIKRIRIF